MLNKKIGVKTMDKQQIQALEAWNTKKNQTLQQQLKAQGLQVIDAKTDELDQAVETIKDVISFIKVNKHLNNRDSAIETTLGGIHDSLHMLLQGMHMEMDGEYCRYDEDEEQING